MPERAHRRGLGVANGTLGELVQGRTVSGDDFLVTFPMPFSSRAYVALDESGVIGGPTSKPKALHMAALVLRHFGLAHLGAQIRIDSKIPEGKGLASSTADIVAVARAIADALARELRPKTIAELAARIEPSDGVMWDDVVVLDHRRGRLIRRLGRLPPLHVLGVDLGGTVDTVAFNAQTRSYSRRDRQRCETVLRQVSIGIARGDARLVGAACTKSALLHQRFLPKPELPELIAVAEEAGAVGVNVAHSGTVAGVLLPGDDADGPRRATRLLHKHLSHARVITEHVVSWGH